MAGTPASSRSPSGAAGGDLTGTYPGPTIANVALIPTKGDLLHASAAGVAGALVIGSAGQVLTVAAGLPSWAAAAGGAVALLSTTTLGADGTIDVQNINQTYSDLILVGVVRGAAAGASDVLLLRVNNDSGANYDLQTLNGGDGVASASETFGATSMQVLGTFVANGAGAGLFDTFELTIPGYKSTTWNKELRVAGQVKLGTSSGNLAYRCFGGYWRSTVAITRVTLFGSGTANLLTGSELRIYGRS